MGVAAVAIGQVDTLELFVNREGKHERRIECSVFGP
jgi:hypothetical protein